MSAAGPEGVSGLIPQVHNLIIGQVGEACSFKFSILAVSPAFRIAHRFPVSGFSPTLSSIYE